MVRKNNQAASLLSFMECYSDKELYYLKWETLLSPRYINLTLQNT